MAHFGEGKTRWAAAHISDVAKLYVLALDRGEPGARYHASVEKGVDARAIAEAIGKGTGLPVRSIATGDIERYFGWMAPFACLDMTASCLDPGAAVMGAQRNRSARRSCCDGLCGGRGCMIDLR